MTRAPELPASTTSAAGSDIGSRLDRLPVTGMHRTMTALIGAGLFFDYFDSNLSGVVSQVLRAEFGISGSALSLLLAAGFVGQFAGSILLGHLSDRIGRRRAFLVNMLTYSVFTLLGAFAPNVGWLIATRVLAGVGIGAEQTLADCYLTEILPARRRGRMIAWAYSLAFCGVPAVGFAALWLVPHDLLGVAGWRGVFVLGAFGTVAVWVLRRRMIESPRWLAARGRDGEADELVRGLEIDAGITPPARPVTAAPRTAPPPAPRFRTLFQRPYARRTTMLWTFCFLSVVAYYGFGTLAPAVLAAKGVGVVQGLAFTTLSFLGYPAGSLLAVPVIDRIERRTLTCWSAGLMAVAGLCFGLSTSAAAVVVSGFCYTLLSNVFSTASHVYLAEQYPTRFRATASGAAYSLSRVGAAILPFALLPILHTGGAGTLFAVVAAAMALLILIVALLGDRTTGTSADAA